MTPPSKEYNFPVSESKEMEIYVFPDREFKIMARRLSKLQENTDRECNEINKMICRQNDTSVS